MTDGGITETTRRILLPTKASANWKCSDCAWSQPFVQRLELEPNVPTQAIEDAFHRHKCTEHRHSKWARWSSDSRADSVVSASAWSKNHPPMHPLLKLRRYASANRKRDRAILALRSVIWSWAAFCLS